MSIIYKVSLEDKILYIGSTKLTIEQRWALHLSEAKRGIHSKLNDAISRGEYLKVEKICDCLNQYVKNLENSYIDMYDTLENGYNTRRSYNQKNIQEKFNIIYYPFGEQNHLETYTLSIDEIKERFNLSIFDILTTNNPVVIIRRNEDMIKIYLEKEIYQYDCQFILDMNE